MSRALTKAAASASAGAAVMTRRVARLRRGPLYAHVRLVLSTAWRDSDAARLVSRFRSSPHACGSPVHQLLGGLLVVLEELAVVLALDDLRVERQRLGLGLVLLRGDGLLQMADQGGVDVLRQTGRRKIGRASCRERV